LNLSQADLASRWGYSGNYIYLLESGKKQIPDKLKPRIAELEGAVPALEGDVLTPVQKPRSPQEIHIYGLLHHIHQLSEGMAFEGPQGYSQDERKEAALSLLGMSFELAGMVTWVKPSPRTPDMPYGEAMNGFVASGAALLQKGTK
jgi:hypothetical protein